MIQNTRRRTRYLNLLFLCLYPLYGFSQLEVKTTLLTLVYLRANLHVELPLEERFSLEMGVRKDFLLNRSFGANIFFSEKARSLFKIDGREFLGEQLNISGISNNYGISLAGKYFFHPRQDKLDRFYAFGYLKYRHYWLRDNQLGLKIKYKRLAPGIGIGFKWIAGRHVVFDFGSGLGYSIYHGFSDNIPFTPSINFAALPIANIDFYSKCSIGYRF